MRVDVPNSWFDVHPELNKNSTGQAATGAGATGQANTGQANTGQAKRGCSIRTDRSRKKGQTGILSDSERKSRSIKRRSEHAIVGVFKAII